MGKYSKFNLSHHRLAACSMGEFVPISAMEVLPGDIFRGGTKALIRVSPLNAPVMHPCHVMLSHWFVPLRLLWTNFESFITGGSDGNDSTTPPYFDLSGTNITAGSLHNHLGVPLGTNAGADQVSALLVRAMQLIWNTWIRDHDLDTALTISLGDGADSTTNQSLQNVRWSKDTFSIARPWTQKGPSVTLPLGTEAPVTGIGKNNATFGGSSGSARETDGT